MNAVSCFSFLECMNCQSIRPCLFFLHFLCNLLNSHIFINTASHHNFWDLLIPHTGCLGGKQAVFLKQWSERLLLQVPIRVPFSRIPKKLSLSMLQTSHRLSFVWQMYVKILRYLHGAYVQKKGLCKHEYKEDYNFCKKKAIRITNSGQLIQQWCHNFAKNKLKLSLIPMLPSFRILSYIWCLS